MQLFMSALVIFLFREATANITSSCHLLGADMIGRRQRNATVKGVFHILLLLLLLPIVLLLPNKLIGRRRMGGACSLFIAYVVDLASYHDEKSVQPPASRPKQKK